MTKKDHESEKAYRRRVNREAARDAAQAAADTKYPGRFTVVIIRGQVRSTRTDR